jgi:hypothetical protein
MAFTRILGPGIHTASNINSHNIKSTGIITAVSFVGDGAGLTGIASTDNIITGTAATFNTYAVDINAGMTVAGVSSFASAISGTTANFSGNVTVGGVLTYEDVKNVDSLGIITARSGVDVDDFLDVGSNIKLGNAGVITATTFKGDGDFVELDVDGHTNLDNVNVAGVTTFASTVNAGTINATLFSGASEVGIQSGGVQIGAGITQLNFVGTGNTFAVSGTTVDISIQGGGGTGAGGTWSSYTAGIATNKSIGVHTNSLDDNDLQGIGASSIDTTITVTVGVDNVGGQSTGVFYLDGVEKPALFELNKRHTYTFDQSDNTNEVYGGANHPLMFSLGPGGDHNSHGHYITGVTYKLDGVNKTMAQYVSGFNAATVRQVVWTIPADAPALLYYWCHHHTGQGNSFAVSNGMAKGMYISNGMIIHDNTLNDNHYIGTAFNGLMAGPVTINGNLFIDGNYVVV